jgi:hypothetical protein
MIHIQIAMSSTNSTLLIVALMTLILSSLGLTAQNLHGAWQLTASNGQTVDGESIKIYSDNYFMFGTYSNEGAFVKAGGGKYNTRGTEYIEVPDFDTTDSTKVRNPQTYSFSLSPKSEELTITKKGGGAERETWKKIDDTSSVLSGAWRFGARVDDKGAAGERRGADSPRQTLKILSGKYFQWAAFNYETGQFSGTGGGTYQMNGNQYTETIRFFSRDNNRVGMSLTFEYNVKGPDWYHKGKGTTGNPVNEVWERIK